MFMWYQGKISYVFSSRLFEGKINYFLTTLLVYYKIVVIMYHNYIKICECWLKKLTRKKTTRRDTCHLFKLLVIRERILIFMWYQGRISYVFCSHVFEGKINYFLTTLLVYNKTMVIMYHNCIKICDRYILLVILRLF